MYAQHFADFIPYRTKLTKSCHWQSRTPYYNISLPSAQYTEYILLTERCWSMGILQELLRQCALLQRIQELNKAMIKRCCEGNDLSYDRFWCYETVMPPHRWNWFLMLITASAACRIIKQKAGEPVETFVSTGSPAAFGAADEARTRYLHLGKVALYQMSYGRIKKSPKIKSVDIGKQAETQ